MAKVITTLSYAGMSTLEAVSLEGHNTQEQASQDLTDQEEKESLIVLRSSHLVGQRQEESSSKESRIEIHVEVRLDN
jgi:hypothetical protein